MIDKEEIGKNIKQLLQGYADETTDVSITLRTPEEADVYLDGEYFNTFSVTQKRFLHNIPENEKERESFPLNVVLRKEETEYEEYRGASLQLPASVYEIKDAFQRARMRSEDENCRISDIELFGEPLPITLYGTRETLRSLNRFAERIKNFSDHQRALLRGCIEQHGTEELTGESLLQMAGTLDGSNLIYDIHSEDELGRFYADNGMLPWLDGADEAVRQYLNYEAIGRDIREKDGGIFTRQGYFYQSETENTEIYDEPVTQEDEYIFKVLLCPKGAETEQEGQWLSLPFSEPEREAFLQELGAGELSDCVLLAVQSMETVLPMFVRGVEEIGKLNVLAEKMIETDRNGEGAKFKAIIASGHCDGLDSAIRAAEHMDMFELYPEPSSLEEYARMVYREQYAPVLPQSLERCFDFAMYAEVLRSEESLSVTEYGVLKETRPARQTMIGEAEEL